MTASHDESLEKMSKGMLNYLSVIQEKINPNENIYRDKIEDDKQDITPQKYKNSQEKMDKSNSFFTLQNLRKSSGLGKNNSSLSPKF